MSIREAETKDIPRILELLHQVNDIHADGKPDLFIHGRTKYGEKDLADIIKNADTPVIVYADSDDSVIGYAFCIICDHPSTSNTKPWKECYIDDICFDESSRGKGYAKELFDAVTSLARKRGCDKATLHVWECNPRAKRFYEKCGMHTYFSAMETDL